MLFLIIAVFTVVYLTWPAPGGRSRPWGAGCAGSSGRLAVLRPGRDHRPLHRVPVLLGDRVVARLGLGPVLDRRWSRASPAWTNYVAVFREQPFARNILNSLFVAVSTVAVSLAPGGGRRLRARAGSSFRGRRLLLFTILGVSMFPQIAVLSGMFELVSGLGLYNNLLALTLAYMIFTLPFTVWVLTTFMRELPKELEEAAIVDGAKPVTIVDARSSCR